MIGIANTRQVTEEERRDLNKEIKTIYRRVRSGSSCGKKTGTMKRRKR